MEALFFASIQTSPVTPTNASLNHRAHLPLSFSSKWLPFKSHRSSPIPSLQKPTNTHKSNSSSCTRNFLSPIKSHLSSLKSSVTNVASTATRWMVVMENPPNAAGSSKSEIIDYYVKALAGVLGNEKEAQMCIYDASWQTNFGFCCDVDEETAKQIAGLPGVLSVRPDIDFEAKEKDYSFSNSLSGLLSKSNDGASQFPPPGNSKYWIVGMEKPSVEVVSKAQMVDYYAKTLTRVLGNEKDAQVSIYHISWQKIYGFCCEMDEECARELAGVPGVLSVQPDTNFESENKQYGGENKTSKLTGSPDSSDASQEPSIKTKRLFVTGLSFYTSEKTLRAAFEGFGELVEVKIIMDKISKRSKGYAFIEYTTEESASAALKEMNGKIINGWMIVVDVAKTNPPKYGLTRTSSTG